MNEEIDKLKLEIEKLKNKNNEFVYIVLI